MVIIKEKKNTQLNETGVFSGDNMPRAFAINYSWGGKVTYVRKPTNKSNEFTYVADTNDLRNANNLLQKKMCHEFIDAARSQGIDGIQIRPTGEIIPDSTFPVLWDR